MLLLPLSWAARDATALCPPTPLTPALSPFRGEGVFTLAFEERFLLPLPLAGEGGGEGAGGPLPYFTAPNVNPCTSCFWLNQPNTTMGAIAITDAADSLAQKRPSGLE